MTHRDDRQRGFALLIVLWTLPLLALLGTQLVATSRQHIQVAHNLIDAATLEAAANGALQQAIFGVLDSSPRHWRSDGSIHAVRFRDAVVAVRVEDEANKVNPNIASPKLLQALLFQAGADPQTAAAVAASIVEWRLAGGSASRPGVIAARYAAAGREYAPSGAQFASPDELGAVLGMTPDLLARLKPHLTVFTDGDPSAATQDVTVAQALAAAGQSSADVDGDEPVIVSVTADARGARNARFTVHAVVRLNARPEGRRYDILVHDRLMNDQP
jgi:general secretion pathway protein K